MIEKLLAQLSYEPQVRRPLGTVPASIVIGGMGGSALAGDALAYLLPARDIRVHRGYGLPPHAPENALFVAVSYSGNTEEAVSFANAAASEKRLLAVVASGGTLASFAEREGLPAAIVPAGYAPRNALIYLVRALLALVGETATLSELAGTSFDASMLVEQAEEDAHFMLDSVPLFYASEGSGCLALIGKAVMNETARMPAFANRFPELNHNEMQAFDEDMPPGLQHLFRFMLLRQGGEDARIVRRMDAFTSLMEERGKLVRAMELSGPCSRRLAETWLRFLLAGRLLAQTRGIDPDAAPLVESFKRLL